MNPKEKLVVYPRRTYLDLIKWIFLLIDSPNYLGLGITLLTRLGSIASMLSSLPISFISPLDTILPYFWSKHSRLFYFFWRVFSLSKCVTEILTERKSFWREHSDRRSRKIFGRGRENFDRVRRKFWLILTDFNHFWWARQKSKKVSFFFFNRCCQKPVTAVN